MREPWSSIARLMALSGEARENGEGHATPTAQNAAAAVARKQGWLVVR
jgi:hypothetical protein